MSIRWVTVFRSTSPTPTGLSRSRSGHLVLIFTAVMGPAFLSAGGCGGPPDNVTVPSDELQRYIAENPDLIDDEIAVLDE